MIVQTEASPTNRTHPICDLAGELAGVPKPVLRTVFGKQLGRRIWERTRRPRQDAAHRPYDAPAGAPPAGSSDATPKKGATVRKRMATDLVNAEILRGMIEYLSRRAGETLDQNRRQARSATLTLCYDDGTREIASARLARPTSDPAELCEAVSELFRSFEAGDAALESINLTTSSVAVESVVEVAPDLSCALAGAGA
jgi:nucleotidyltransferase/DNA polymerase involved in DNA repair